MPDHHDAHPYGRSVHDVRRRTLREARHRRMRITQLIVFSALIILLVGAVAVAVNLVRSPQPAPPAAATPSAASTCPAAGAVPAPPAEVTVTVLNGTSTRGLAGDVTAELAERGYATGKAGNAQSADAPAAVIYGSGGYLAAASVAAQIDGAVLVPGDAEGAEGAEVTLVIGADWPGLRAPEAATAALAEPVAVPEGCAS
ncbi:LytR C-terminal domain-containing protein [Brachybacterium hainanense]|uniref:LytR C-terminal domain-containing protein n=1 Tax=Brachybacterium hainanense TaxID=1541174 RepID=A0ABV6RGD5_9MICO